MSNRPSEQRDKVIPHPAYRRLVEECLRDMNELSQEERDMVIMVLRLRVVASRRQWLEEIQGFEARVLGREA